ncbi:MAG TPA: YraN family protein [Dehalococcoidia bacterium]|nr:YraN family protein [Dehalococcoidia bacterium]
MNRKETGDRGEKAAQSFLKKKGYRIREINWRCREGEIDIVAEKRGCLVFIEVRTKTGDDFGSPEESVTAAKKAKLTATALSYVSSHSDVPESWRIDFIGIDLDARGQPTRIEQIENAVW